MAQQIKDRSAVPEGGRKVVPTESHLRFGEGKDRRRRRRKKQSGSVVQDSNPLGESPRTWCQGMPRTTKSVMSTVG